MPQNQWSALGDLPARAPAIFYTATRMARLPACLAKRSAHRDKLEQRKKKAIQLLVPIDSCYTPAREGSMLPLRGLPAPRGRALASLRLPQLVRTGACVHTRRPAAVRECPSHPLGVEKGAWRDHAGRRTLHALHLGGHSPSRSMRRDWRERSRLAGRALSRSSSVHVLESDYLCQLHATLATSSCELLGLGTPPSTYGVCTGKVWGSEHVQQFFLVMKGGATFASLVLQINVLLRTNHWGRKHTAHRACIMGFSGHASLNENTWRNICQHVIRICVIL